MGKSGDYFTYNVAAMRDTSLSWAAKGLHAYAMANIATGIDIQNLSKHTLSGAHSSKSAMNELIAAGYALKIGNHYAVFGTIEQQKDYLVHLNQQKP